MIIAHITDFHIAEEGHFFDKKYQSANSLEQTVKHIQSLPQQPDVILATGDLSETSTLKSYERLRELLSPLDQPVHLLPGNHDNRNHIRAVFSDHHYLPSDGFIQYIVESHTIRLIALDTVAPNKIGGILCSDRLTWLENGLCQAPTRPTLIFMHHPPFLTGITSLDNDRDMTGLIGAENFGAIVSRHPQIERIVCGHLHRPIQVLWHGRLARVAPSTAHQFALDFDGNDIKRVLEPGTVDLHVWIPKQGLVSHVSYIGARPHSNRLNTEKQNTTYNTAR